MIVATAGHIDHGKTSLVKALTGIDTDRLPEEKKRGMSIDLGFAYKATDSGRRIGFVDVPGHEKFIRNMLAGVAGIDYAILTVAADDGPMPQTLEHLAILDMLKVEDGVVAVTKIDRVTDQRQDMVVSEIIDLLKGSCLSGADIVRVSATDGTGIDKLREHLETMNELIGQKEIQGNFRISIDRSFSVPGSGLIVTGSVLSGEVLIGDKLTLSPEGAEVRVRSMHSDGQESKSGIAGQRCALNVSGQDLKRVNVQRGDSILASNIFSPTPRFDSSIKILQSEKKPLKHWTPVHLHVGAAVVPGRVALLGEKTIQPGGDALAQIVLDRRISILKGDRFILRDQSAQRTIAGGSVIDPFPPIRGRTKPNRIKLLKDLENTNAKESLEILLQSNPGGVKLSSFMVAWNLNSSELKLILDTESFRTIGAESQKFIFSKRGWLALEKELLEKLEGWHGKHPERSSIHTHQLRSLFDIRLTLELFQCLLNEVSNKGLIRKLGGGYFLPGFQPTLSKKDQAIWVRVKPLLEEGFVKAPVVSELASRLDLDSKALNKYMVNIAKLGMVHQVARNRFLLPAA
ncbi:MAG: selenocysteine-specific translation elongation factor, partial [Pseudomonadota bacterium]|nr:selenocysteine-specific translation elongation factor [Pseudomonadota bacterium]